jgi:predicted membrane protein
MLRNYYINREWLLSPSARQVYRASASMTLVLFLLLISLTLVDHIPDGVFPWVKLLLLFGVLGTAITLIGMEYFLFAFDNSSAFKKVFWFCAMLVPFLGPPLYCFLIYSRAEPFRNKQEPELVHRTGGFPT